jgi:transcriptional regulator with PAS, ATPase and Fis domain
MANMETEETISTDKVPSRIKSKCIKELSPEMSLEALLQKYEKNLLQQKLAEIGRAPGNKDKLAEILNVSRATLYRKLKKFGLL